MKLNLQYFADQEDSTEQVDTQEASQEQQEHEEKTFTRDQIAKMISAQKAEWEKEKEQEIEEAKSEAERLAKLSKDEREKEKNRKRQEQLDKREKELATRELKLETQSLLAEEALPAEFLDVVMADSADQISQNISNIRQIFDQAVEKRVDERLKQTAPKRGINSKGGSMTYQEIMAIKDDKARRQAIQDNRELFIKGD